MLTLDKNTVTAMLETKVPKKEPLNQLTFWYGGWSLLELRKMKPELFYNQGWYDTEAFAKKKHPEGMYTVTFRMKDSNNKTAEEQKALLKDGEILCPVAIFATATVLALIETGNDPFENDLSRCAEQAPLGRRAGLLVYEGLVRVDNYWDGYRLDEFWLGAARRLPDA